MALDQFLARKAVAAKFRAVSAELQKGTRLGERNALRAAREAVLAADILPERSRERRLALLQLSVMEARNGNREAALAASQTVWTGALAADDHDELDAAAANNIGAHLSQEGEFVEAAALFEQSLAIKRRVLGPRAQELVGSLQDLFACADQLEDTPLALRTAQELHAVLSDLAGPDDPTVQAAAHNVAVAEARLAAEKGSLAPLCLEDVNPFDTDDPAAREIIAVYEARDFARAQAMHRSWREDRLLPLPPIVAEELLELTDPVFAWAVSQDKSGVAAADAGELKIAEAAFEQVAAVMEVYSRPDRKVAARSNLARILTQQHRFAEARHLFAAALTLTEGLENDHEWREPVLQNVANLYWTMAELEAPDPLEHHELLRPFEGRPDDYSVRLRMRFAEPVAGESPLASCARQLDARSAIYASVGDQPRARRLLELSLELWRIEAGCDVRQLLSPLIALIEHDLEHDHPDTAETALDEALSICGEVKFPAKRHLDLMLKRLQLLLRLGRLEEVRHVAEELQAFARNEALGEDLQALAQENLAIVQLQLGDVAAARPTLEFILGREGDAANSPPERLVTLAQFAMVTRRYEQAEAWYARILDAWRPETGEWTTSYARALSNAGTVARYRGYWQLAAERHRRSSEIRQALLGPHHPDVLRSRLRHAVDLRMLGRAEDALDETLAAVAVGARLLGRASTMSSEKAFISTIERNAHLTGLAIALLKDARKQRSSEVYEAVLRQKSLSALALFTRRNTILSGRYPELAPQLEELHELQALLGAASLAGGDSAATLAEAEARRDALETELARRIPEMAVDSHVADVRAADVAAALPKNAVLAELIAYRPWHWEGLADDPTLETIETAERYGMFLLNAAGGVEFVDVGPAEALDTDIISFNKAIEAGQRHDTDAAALVRAFATCVTDFARSRNATRIYLAPDKKFSLLAFDALTDRESRPIVANFEVLHLATGRDLLRANDVASCGPPVVVFAPDYDAAMTADRRELVLEPSAELDALRKLSLRFAALPGAAREGGMILKMFPQAVGLTGAEATRTALEGQRRPSFLHIASHGYFLPPINEHLTALDPMLRSGLVLAGANTAAEKGAEAIDEGLLTAASVATLDLLGTDLVVLSACESGLGEAQAGEGVFGLRRAFAIAGTRTLVMSLWKVGDAATAELMRLYYEALARGEGKAAALRASKQALLDAGAPARDWAAFILEGDGSPLGLTS